MGQQLTLGPLALHGKANFCQAGVLVGGMGILDLPCPVGL